MRSPLYLAYAAIIFCSAHEREAVGLPDNARQYLKDAQPNAVPLDEVGHCSPYECSRGKDGSQRARRRRGAVRPAPPGSEGGARRARLIHRRRLVNEEGRELTPSELMMRRARRRRFKDEFLPRATYDKHRDGYYFGTGPARHGLLS